MTMAEHAAIISEVTRKKLIYNQVFPDKFEAYLPHPAANCVSTMFEKGEPVRDMELTRAQVPTLSISQ